MSRLLPLLLASVALLGGMSSGQTPAPSRTPSHPPPSTLQGDPSHPAQTERWLDTRLYFGLGPADAPDKGVSEAAWRDFLDKEVTPRFPFRPKRRRRLRPMAKPQPAKGQRLRSKMLVIDYPDTADNSSRIEAIRSA